MAKQSVRFLSSGGCRISVSVPVGKRYALERICAVSIDSPVRSSAHRLTSLIRAKAPSRTGDLRQGIIVSPTPERSSNPNKIVYDVCMDARMNDTFVKVTKSGKRYYYPASQEYGFRIGRVKRKPGLYYMRDASEQFRQQHTQTVSEGVDKIMEEL